MELHYQCCPLRDVTLITMGFIFLIFSNFVMSAWTIMLLYYRLEGGKYTPQTQTHILLSLSLMHLECVCLHLSDHAWQLCCDLPSNKSWGDLIIWPTMTMPFHIIPCINHPLERHVGLDDDLGLICFGMFFILCSILICLFTNNLMTAVSLQITSH